MTKKELRMTMKEVCPLESWRHLQAPHESAPSFPHPRVPGDGNDRRRCPRYSDPGNPFVILRLDMSASDPCSKARSPYRGERARLLAWRDSRATGSVVGEYGMRVAHSIGSQLSNLPPFPASRRCPARPIVD